MEMKPIMWPLSMTGRCLMCPSTIVAMASITFVFGQMVIMSSWGVMMSATLVVAESLPSRMIFFM